MPSDSFKDYHADLGLELGASAGAIRKAFQDLAKKHHPDKSGIADATVFRRVREAFEKLSDPEYRAQYDRSYWRRKFQTDDIPTEEENRSAGEENFGDTRNTSHGAETQEARSASPPPVKPQSKPNEPSWQYFLGKAYTTWQKEEAAYRVRHPEVYESPLSSGPPTPKPGGMAHGMVVLMSHPCVQQSCIYKSTAWRLQTGGGDHCVFCMTVHTGGRRCPGCEVLACKVCLEKVRALERRPFEGLRSKAQYCSSGG